MDGDATLRHGNRVPEGMALRVWRVQLLEKSEKASRA
jgi:hypothetical protein